MLENKDIDAILCGTPDHWHALVTTMACQADKDVYCEKPLTLTIHEGRVMTQVARATKRIVQTGSQQRSDKKFRTGCELVRNGRLGKLKSVKVGLTYVNFNPTVVPDAEPPAELDYDLWLGPAPWRPYNVNRVHYNFRFFWDYSGGQMTNWGAHHLDIAQWGMGMDDIRPDRDRGHREVRCGEALRGPDRERDHVYLRQRREAVLQSGPGSQDRHHVRGREGLDPREPRRPRGQP
jgi:predicted dehydrogenase